MGIYTGFKTMKLHETMCFIISYENLINHYTIKCYGMTRKKLCVVGAET
jgi:hypothetical protein